MCNFKFSAWRNPTPHTPNPSPHGRGVISGGWRPCNPVLVLTHQYKLNAYFYYTNDFVYTLKCIISDFAFICIAKSIIGYYCRLLREPLLKKVFSHTLSRKLLCLKISEWFLTIRKFFIIKVFDRGYGGNLSEESFPPITCNNACTEKCRSGDFTFL